MTFTEIRTKHVQRFKYYIFFLLGFTLSIWSIPKKALSVPRRSTYDGMTNAFYPVTEYYFILILIPIAYALLAYWSDRNVESAYSRDEYSKQ